ncbi:helix-turn-helix domain-containing protein [Aminobacter anthyllidis]|uniref:Helix-turn-helix domain-containing protein n=1 Tax=Aminobacter anthyllidis TaxID=1035067 RepID=A0A9X1AGQ4_9HYPH|nr:AraC family transcriptional regulator [Aminobacter anthyllidis]MBT1159261.1 helix-turn-helix domain-containing protein [Aminobacter anthyllidis]
MTETHRDEILFHTPGRHAEAYPYKILVAGRTRFTARDGLVTRRFHHHTLILTISGRGLIEVAGQRFAAGAGSVVWLDTAMQYAHGCHADADHWLYLWMSIDGHGLDAVFAFLRVGQSPVFAGSGGAEPLFEQALDMLGHRSQTTDALSSTVVSQAIALLVAERGEQEEDSGERIQRLMRALRADIARNWQIEDMADISSLSASQLHRQFRQKTGTTPMDWMRHERMNLAKRLLTESDAKISAVALSCGYGDPYHFSRDFRRIAGQSPSEFRRAQGQ